MTVTEFIGKQPRKVVTGFGVLLIAAATIADYFITTALLEVAIVHLVPVSFFSWFLGRRAGVAVAVLSGALALTVNLRLAPVPLAYWAALIWLVVFLAAALLIAELRSLYDRERTLSRVDVVTSVANRRAMFECLAAERNRALRHHVPITVAYLDLDGFKQVNDQFGHHTGDRLLRVVAGTIHDNIRPTDFVARMGGDEFAIVLPHTGKKAATTVLDRVRRALSSAMQQQHWPVTFSIGVVTFLRAPESVDEMVRRADEAMYAAKVAGKNTVEQREIAA